MKQAFAMFAALLTLQSIQPAFAETSDRVKFSGFGTVGGVWSDSNESDFRSRLEHTSGAGRSHARDTGVDTLFGVQADIAMADKLSSTVQLQSRRMSDGSADPYVEWANLKYRVSPNLDVRAGRIVTPMFMVSDTRAVGYSNTAVRLPQGVYVTNPITVVDGGDITYRTTVGDWLVQASLDGGSISQTLNEALGQTTYDIDVVGAASSFERNGHVLRVGYHEGSIDAKSPSISLLDGALDALEAVDASPLDVPGATTLRSNIAFNDLNASFLAVGYAYDPGNWLIQSELVQRRSEKTTIPDLDAGYILVGWRVNQFTPYFQIAKVVEHIDRNALPVLDTAAISALPLAPGDVAQLVAGATGVNQLTAGLRTGQYEHTDMAIGLRWDLAKQFAIKAQYDRIDKESNSKGAFVNTTPAFDAREESINIFSATLDFVF